MDIRFVKREDIDKVKWNSCVHYANNGNIFGYMWYLDNVAKEWDALVEGDYESVFPLIHRQTRWQGKELYQPPLMRELGIYSINVLSPRRIQAFLDAIPEEYRKVVVDFNEQVSPPEETDFVVKERQNYQLWLQRPYEEIADGYDRELLVRLDKAEQGDLIPVSGLKPETLADFFRYFAPGQSQKEWKANALLRIMYNALHRGWGFFSGVQNRDQELLAVNFFLYSHGKVMSLMPLAKAEGRERFAQEYLLNLLVRSHADRPLLLDFNADGADGLPQMFGAQQNPYYRLERNRRLWGVL
jgi:hypothetical protein